MKRFITLVSLVSLAALVAGPGCSSVPRQNAKAKPASPAPELAESSVDNLNSEERVKALSHFAAGLSLDLNADPEEALAHYWNAAIANPAYEPLVLETARRLLRAKKTEQAIELLTKASETPSATGVMHAWLGLAYAQAGKNDQAIAAQKMAIKKMPRSLPAYQNLAQLYLQNSRTNETIEVVATAEKQNSTDPEYWLGLAELYNRLVRGKIMTEEEGKKKILTNLDKAASLQLGPVTIQKIADGYFLNAEYAKAEALYKRLLAEDSDSPLLRQKLANIYLRTGKKEEALKEFEEIRKSNPTDPQTYFLLGGLAYEEKKFKEAAEYYETALKLSPDIEQLYYDLAGLKITLKKPAEALDHLEQARSKFKINFTMEFYSGVANALLEKYTEAIRHLTSAEIIAKANEPHRLNQFFYYQMGSAYERNKDYEQSEKCFRKCLEIAPDYADALNYLGYMWAERGVNLEEALALTKKAIAQEPENAAFLDSVGWVLFKLNRREEALEHLLKAVAYSQEPDPTLYDHLGDIYASLNQFDRAREAWEKSLKAQPDDQVRKKLEKLPAVKPTS